MKPLRQQKTKTSRPGRTQSPANIRALRTLRKWKLATQLEAPASAAPVRTPLQDHTTKILSELGSILASRGETYADYSDNSRAAVGILRALGFEFPSQFSDPQIGAMLMMACKLSRFPASPGHRDNWIDLANYAVLGLAMTDRGD